MKVDNQLNDDDYGDGEIEEDPVEKAIQTK